MVSSVKKIKKKLEKEKNNNHQRHSIKFAELFLSLFSLFCCFLKIIYPLSPIFLHTFHCHKVL